MVMHDYDFQNIYKKYQISAGIILTCLKILLHVDQSLSLENQVIFQ
jgi:hypothetical protein